MEPTYTRPLNYRDNFRSPGDPGPVSSSSILQFWEWAPPYLQRQFVWLCLCSSAVLLDNILHLERPHQPELIMDRADLFRKALSSFIDTPSPDRLGEIAKALRDARAKSVAMADFQLAFLRAYDLWASCLPSRTQGASALHEAVHILVPRLNSMSLGVMESWARDAMKKPLLEGDALLTQVDAALDDLSLGD